MTAYVIVGAIVAAMLIALRVHIVRDERWLAEQARLDQEARAKRRRPVEPEAPEIRMDERCRICGGRIGYIEYSAGNGDVLDCWWAHEKHPADGHDAEPRVMA